MAARRKARVLTAWVARDGDDYYIHLRKPKQHTWFDSWAGKNATAWTSGALLYEVCQKYWELTGGKKLKSGACERMRIKLTCKAVK